MNNIILRYTNYIKSIVLKINLKELDVNRDEVVLGIQSSDKDKGCHFNMSDAILKSQDFTNNMIEYWGEFGKQIKICDQSMKETDLKMLRMYFCERMIPEYNQITLKNTVDRIM